MDLDFSNLKKLDVEPDHTVFFDLGDIDDFFEGWSLELLHAGQSNKRYYNDVLRSATKHVKKNSKSITISKISKNRNEDREFYSRHIVKSWSGVVDSSGNQAEFNEQNCQDFLFALPDHIFDELRNFSSDPTNFNSEAIDSENAAKN